MRSMRTVRLPTVSTTTSRWTMNPASSNSAAARSSNVCSFCGMLFVRGPLAFARATLFFLEGWSFFRVMVGWFAQDVPSHFSVNLSDFLTRSVRFLTLGEGLFLRSLNRLHVAPGKDELLNLVTLCWQEPEDAIQGMLK